MVPRLQHTYADPEKGFPADLSSEWDELADRSDAPLWLRPGWFEIWWRAFGSGRLVALTAYRGDSLVGVAPLVERGRVLASPTNYHTPAYGFVVDDQAAADDLAAAILRRSRRTVVMTLVDPTEATSVALLHAARHAGRLHVTRTLQQSPYVVTDGPWPDYESGRATKLVRDLRRRERRMAEEGSSVFSIHTGQFDLDPLMEDCFRTEATSWKGDRGTAMDSQPATRDFYTQLASYAQARGELMLAFLRLDEQAIAVQLAIRSAGAVTVLKLGHDEAFARFAPGKLLLRHVLNHCFRDTTTCYDFSGQPNPYKMEWADGQRQLDETRVFARRPIGAVGWAWWRYGRPLVKRAADVTPLGQR